MDVVIVEVAKSLCLTMDVVGVLLIGLTRWR